MLVVRPRAFAALVVCAFVTAASLLLVRRHFPSFSHSTPASEDLHLDADVLQSVARAKYSVPKRSESRDFIVSTVDQFPATKGPRRDFSRIKQPNV
ncbi:hypothetical protein RB195_000038 [Necator americanus]|uniref:Uncharacterized protein n=1 Tax=Necator americanus TaxID=51031 RepID=A0ABR1D8H9_NECAM